MALLLQYEFQAELIILPATTSMSANLTRDIGIASDSDSFSV